MQPVCARICLLNQDHSATVIEDKDVQIEIALKLNRLITIKEG